MTIKVARAAAALLPLLVCKALAGSVLRKIPVPGAVTFTLIVQVPAVMPVPAGIAPPVKVTVVPPGVAVTTPPQVETALGVAAITTPGGKVSVSGAVKVATRVFGLDKVIVSVEIPPAVIEAGLKALLTVGGMGGGGGTTVKVALAAPLLLPLLVCKAPAGSVLVKVPLAAAVTLTVTVQVPGAPPGIAPPVKVIVLPPAGAVSTPPQVVLAFGVAAITRPAGRLSVSGAVSVAAPGLGLIKVMVLVATPPAVMVVGVKATLSKGAAGDVGTTVKVALAPPLLLPLLVCKEPAGRVLV